MSATTTSMDLTRLELEAKATARKQVANLLQRPDQLEKVDQIRRRVSRKKVRGNFSHCFVPLNFLCFYSFGQYALWLKKKQESITVGCVPPACLLYKPPDISTGGSGGSLNRSPVIANRCH